MTVFLEIFQNVANSLNSILKEITTDVGKKPSYPTFFIGELTSSTIKGQSSLVLQSGHSSNVTNREPSIGNGDPFFHSIDSNAAERIFDNGSYMAAQFSYIQKSFVMYGIVPEIDVRNEKIGPVPP